MIIFLHWKFYSSPQCIKPRLPIVNQYLSEQVFKFLSETIFNFENGCHILATNVWKGILLQIQRLKSYPPP